MARQHYRWILAIRSAAVFWRPSRLRREPTGHPILQTLRCADRFPLNLYTRIGRSARRRCGKFFRVAGKKAEGHTGTISTHYIEFHARWISPRHRTGKECFLLPGAFTVGEAETCILFSIAYPGGANVVYPLSL